MNVAVASNLLQQFFSKKLKIGQGYALIDRETLYCDRGGWESLSWKIHLESLVNITIVSTIYNVHMILLGMEMTMFRWEVDLIICC